MTTDINTVDMCIFNAHEQLIGLDLPPGPLKSALQVAIESLNTADDLSRAMAEAETKACVFCGRWTLERTEDSMAGPEAPAHISCNALDREMADQGGSSLPTWVYEFVSRLTTA